MSKKLIFFIYYLKEMFKLDDLMFQSIKKEDYSEFCNFDRMYQFLVKNLLRDIGEEKLLKMQHDYFKKSTP